MVITVINGGHRGIYTDRRQVNYDRARRDPRWCIEVEVIEDIYLLCVCEVAVAMVMIGESARWQGGSLLENFGHRGALELILQSLTYQSRGALHLNVLY